MSDNATANPLSQVTLQSAESQVPVQALGTKLFHVIHLIAVSTCFTSAIASFAVLCYMFHYNNKSTFPKWRVGERLVAYLCISDLILSISHGVDHLVVYVTRNHTPEPVCSMFGFVLHVTTLSQSLLVNMVAITAVIVIVKEQRAAFGKYDWKLLSWAFGSPILYGVVIGALGYLGPIGAWCQISLTTSTGVILTSTYAIIILCVFCINAICYIIVWVKIRQVENSLEEFRDDAQSTDQGDKQSTSSAQSMAVIVLVYIYQWCCYVAFTIWNYFGEPYVGLLVAVVLVTSLGGVYNAIAYTLMRMYRKRAGRKARLKAREGTTTSGIKAVSDKI